MNMTLARRRTARKVFTYVVLSIWAIIVLFPIYFVATTSFKDPLAVTGQPRYIPWLDFKPTLDAYRYVLGEIRGEVLPPFFHSLIVALASATIALFLGAMAGYALARFNYSAGPWKNNDIAFWFLSQRMLPPVVVVLPFLVMYKYLHLTDTLWGLIIAYAGFNLPFAVWIMRDFFAALPRDMEESALIDGCSRLSAFYRITLPLAAPGLIAAFLFCIIFAWNEYLFALMLTFQNSVTFPVYLAGQSGQRGIQFWNIGVMAMLAIGPMLILGVILEKYIAKGLVAGAVK